MILKFHLHLSNVGIKTYNGTITGIISNSIIIQLGQKWCGNVLNLSMMDSTSYFDIFGFKYF